MKSDTKMFFFSGFVLASAPRLPVVSLKTRLFCCGSSRFLYEEPTKDLLILTKLRHLERLELIVENSNTLKLLYLGGPWPSPSLQQLIRELRELSENRFTIITTMRQRDRFRECCCVWDGD